MTVWDAIADIVEEAGQPELAVVARGGGWIPVGERLPPTGEEVLIWDGDCYLAYIARRDPIAWHSMENGRFTPTHWRPMPDPPKPEDHR